MRSAAVTLKFTEHNSGVQSDQKSTQCTAGNAEATQLLNKDTDMSVGEENKDTADVERERENKDTADTKGGRKTKGHSVVLAAVHDSLGLPGWRLFRGFTLLSPFSHSSPSLIGPLASVDVKQQTLTQRTLLVCKGRGK